MRDDEDKMRIEYDFRKGTRGKFYRPDAAIRLPMYLDPEVLAFLAKQAEKKGVEVDQIANELLKREIARVK